MSGAAVNASIQHKPQKQGSGIPGKRLVSRQRSCVPRSWRLVLAWTRSEVSGPPRGVLQVVTIFCASVSAMHGSVCGMWVTGRKILCFAYGLIASGDEIRTPSRMVEQYTVYRSRPERALSACCVELFCIGNLFDDV